MSTRAGKAQPNQPFGVCLSHALSALVASEPNWWSESLEPGDWDPFHAPLDPATELTPETFRICAKEAKSRAVRSRPFSDYLDYVLGPEAGLSEPSVSIWHAFKQISELLLADRHIFSFGENELVKVRIYLVGRIADGGVVGIHALTVET